MHDDLSCLLRNSMAEKRLQRPDSTSLSILRSLLSRCTKILVDSQKPSTSLASNTRAPRLLKRAVAHAAFVVTSSGAAVEAAADSNPRVRRQVTIVFTP